MKIIIFIITGLMITSICSYAIEPSQQHPIKWQLLGPGDADQVTSLSVMKNGDVFAGIDIGGVYKSSNDGDSWKPFNDGLWNLDVTTKVLQSPIDNNILFVGTRGGLYKSNNYGQSWTRIENGLPSAQNYSLSGSIGGLIIDPVDKTTIYTAIGYRPSYDGTVTVRKSHGSRFIYKSIDNGESWVAIAAFPEDTKVSQLSISKVNNDVILAATNKGLFISINGTKNWNRILDKPTYNILFDRENKNTIYAAIGKEGVLKTDDLGKSWDKYNNGLPSFNFLGKFENRYSVLSEDPHNADIIYLINSTWGRSGGLYQSKNKGKQWTLISENMPESWLKTSRRMNDIAVSSIDSNMLYLGSSRYIYSSDNQGKNWQQKISKKINKGWSHTGINVFGQTRTVKVDTKNPKILYIATADHKIIKSVDNGKSWNLLLKNERKANNVWDIDMCPSNDHKLHIITSDSSKKVCILNSTDEGNSWNKNCLSSISASRKEKIRVSPHNCNTVIAATKNGIIKSQNSGKTWNPISLDTMHPIVRAIEFDINNKDTIYAGTDNGLYISKNNGNDWSHIKNTNKMLITAIHISRENSDTIHIGTQLSKLGPGAIYKSLDHGKTWKKTLHNMRRYVSSITSLPAEPDFLYASTLDDNYHDLSKGKGIYRSIDQGDSWHRIDKDLPVYRAYDITTSKLRPYDVFLSTNGSGAYIANEKHLVDKLKK